MKAVKVGFVVFVLFVQIFSQSYNESISKTEENSFLQEKETFFQSNNNSSSNNTGGNNSNVSDAHCLVLTNFTISQTNYASIHLTNTCSAAINYPGINASANHSGVSGLYDTWWYVISGNNGTTNNSNVNHSYQMGWQLSFNQSLLNGTNITLDFEATVLNCGPNNSWSNDCPNSNNSSLSYQFQYISPETNLVISSFSFNTNNDRISLSYYSLNYSGSVAWEYTSANGTSNSSSYSNSYVNTIYFYPDFFGIIQICGSISGDTTCINATRVVRPLLGEIDSPSDNFTTNASSVYVSYFANNYSYGTLELNNQTVHYLQHSNANNSNSNNSIIVNIPSGWSTLCLELTGDNGTSLENCVNVYKPPAIVRLIIDSANLSSDNASIVLSYKSENWSGQVVWEYPTSNGTEMSYSYASYYLRTTNIYPSTFGLIEICGTISNLSTECISLYRTARILEGDIISPNNNSQYHTTTVQISYTANNFTSGSITLDGATYRYLGPSFDSNETESSNSNYSQINLQVEYGFSTICLELSGDNGAQLSDCIVIERVVPPHNVSIVSPVAGMSFTGQFVNLNYVLENSSSHYFTVNNITFSPIDNSTINSVELPVGYGTQNVCVVSYDYAGTVTNACVVVNMINPNADSDSDGVADNFDLCQNTITGSVTDTNGCALYQLDDDEDGISDAVDICSGTFVGSQVNSVGCSSSQRDSDSDGIVDSFDQCPSTIIGTVVDQTGCDYNNASGNIPSGNGSSGTEEAGLPGFGSTMAIVSICIAFFVGFSKKRESEN